DGDASSVREALAMGVRVVASDTDFRPRGVRLFPKGDADALADAIDKALAEPPAKVDSSSLSALLTLYDALPLGRLTQAAASAPAPRERGPESERGPERAGERGPERAGERGPERAGERGPERAGERGPERAGERGPERAG